MNKIESERLCVLALMYKEIESMVKSCKKCQEFSRRNNKDPVLPRELPLVAWTLLELDLFTCENTSYLLVIDVTLRFPVVRVLPNETSRSVINALKGIYCDFGLPKRILSDNGPCFKSFEFIDFHAKLNISVEKSSAYNHNSVGSVERMVQTIKQIMAKNADEAWLAMLIFRATDIPGLNKSPGEILNGRKYRTGLPVIDIRTKDSEMEIEKLSENRTKLASSHGTKGKELPKIPVGTEILYEFNPDSDKNKRPKWCKGTVMDRLNPRKYQILTDSDRVITQSRKHIKGYMTKSGRISKMPDRFGCN